MRLFLLLGIEEGPPPACGGTLKTQLASRSFFHFASLRSLSTRLLANSRTREILKKRKKRLGLESLEKKIDCFRDRSVFLFVDATPSPLGMCVFGLLAHLHQQYDFLFLCMFFSYVVEKEKVITRREFFCSFFSFLLNVAAKTDHKL